MPLTFVLLQTVNAALAAASLWLRLRNPGLWDDQAIVLSVLAGAVLGSATAILLGLNIALSQKPRWGFLLTHLVLTLAFAGLQIYLLCALGRDLGVVHFLKAKLG